MSKKKKKNHHKNSAPKARRTKRLPVIIASIIVLSVVIAVIVVSVRACSENAKASELCDYAWVSASATNASGDEVDIREVYDVRYSNYQGSLTFDKDGSFRLWLTPGDMNDGTHSGVYELSDDVITAVFDEGTQTEFQLERENGQIKAIIVEYDDYKVYFTKQ